MVNIERLYRKKIFVDSNAFIYFFTGQCNKITKEIFRLAEKRWLNLITTVRVLDEVCFKTMIISAKLKFGIKRNILEKLKKDNDKIKSVSNDVKKVLEFVEQIGIDTRKYPILN